MQPPGPSGVGVGSMLMSKEKHVQFLIEKLNKKNPEELLNIYVFYSSTVFGIYTFLIRNLIFHLSLELLTEFWKMSLKDAYQLLSFIVNFYTF